MDLLQALAKLAKNQNYSIPKKGVDYDNSIQEVGSGLEAFFKLLFVDEKSPQALVNPFIYQGSANRPPDLITRNPELSFEIKKQNSNSDIQLNSSHPEQYLSRNNPKLSKECKESFNAESIPMIYAIGIIKNNNVESLWIVDGSIYSANNEVYESIKNSTTSAMSEHFGDTLHPTNEIANLQGIDPLKITILRIRGMWIIQHPSKVFSYLNLSNSKIKVLLSSKTYMLFSKKSQETIENSKGIKIVKAKYFKSPDNPSKLIDGVIIQF